MLDRLSAWCELKNHRDVRIENIDNPGWTMTVDLGGMTEAKNPFGKIDDERSELNWVACEVTDEGFRGDGGPLNLREIVVNFLRLASLHQEQADLSRIKRE